MNGRNDISHEQSVREQWVTLAEPLMRAVEALQTTLAPSGRVLLYGLYIDRNTILRKTDATLRTFMPGRRQCPASIEIKPNGTFVASVHPAEAGVDARIFRGHLNDHHAVDELIEQIFFTCRPELQPRPAALLMHAL